MIEHMDNTKKYVPVCLKQSFTGPLVLVLPVIKHLYPATDWIWHNYLLFISQLLIRDRLHCFMLNYLSQWMCFEVCVRSLCFIWYISVFINKIGVNWLCLFWAMMIVNWKSRKLGSNQHLNGAFMFALLFIFRIYQ